jgi:hypothetical protein
MFNREIEDGYMHELAPEYSNCLFIGCFAILLDCVFGLPFFITHSFIPDELTEHSVRDILSLSSPLTCPEGGRYDASEDEIRLWMIYGRMMLTIILQCLCAPNPIKLASTVAQWIANVTSKTNKRDNNLSITTNTSVDSTTSIPTQFDHFMTKPQRVGKMRKKTQTLRSNQRRNSMMIVLMKGVRSMASNISRSIVENMNDHAKMENVSSHHGKDHDISNSVSSSLHAIKTSVIDVEMGPKPIIIDFETQLPTLPNSPPSVQICIHEEDERINHVCEENILENDIRDPAILHQGPTTEQIKASRLARRKEDKDVKRRWYPIMVRLLRHRSRAVRLLARSIAPLILILCVTQVSNAAFEKLICYVTIKSFLELST